MKDTVFMKHLVELGIEKGFEFDADKVNAEDVFFMSIENWLMQEKLIFISFQQTSYGDVAAFVTDSYGHSLLCNEGLWHKAPVVEYTRNRAMKRVIELILTTLM